MAVVLNASTSAGAVLSSDTSGVLQLSNNGTVAVTFTSGSMSLVNDASINGLTVGKGGGSSTQSTAVGYQALLNQTGAGDYNTAFGYGAGLGITTGQANVAIGRLSMYTNTVTGSNNDAFGTGALQKLTSGGNNTAVGDTALRDNTSGSTNTAVGTNALLQNTTASNNTAVGYQAGYSNTTGSYNVFLGYQAGYTSNNTSFTAVGNTLIGAYAGYSLTTGYGNTFIGSSDTSNAYASGYYVTTGSKNTIIGGYNGNQGGLDIRTASNYIVLSDGSGNPRVYTDNNGYTYINGNSGNAGGLGIGSQRLNSTTSTSGGESALCATCSSGNNASVALFLANSTSGYTANMLDIRTGMASGTGYNAISYKSDTNVTRFYVDGSGVIHSTSTSITAISDATLKTNIKPLETGLAEVLKLQARRFDWKDGSGTNVAGFISQEVETVLPDLVAPWKQDENTTLLGLKMGDMIPTMVKAIQELSAQVQALNAKVGITS